MTELAAYWNDRAANYDASYSGENHAAWLPDNHILIPGPSWGVFYGEKP